MAESLEKIEAEENEAMKTHLMTSYKNKKQQFDSIFDKSVHDALVKRGERRFSHKALQGALMISMYSEEPRWEGATLMADWSSQVPPAAHPPHGPHGH